MIGYYSTLAEADAYFTGERLESSAWDALTVTSTKDEKTACLTQAFNRLYYSKKLVLPKPADATADQLIPLKKAQAEMAYYIAQHGEDEDIRRGLQAQGVSGAGAVKETYDKDHLDETAIPQVVMDLLVGFWEGTDTPFFAHDIDRDEDYSVDEDVTDVL